MVQGLFSFPSPYSSLRYFPFLRNSLFSLTIYAYCSALCIVIHLFVLDFGMLNLAVTGF